MTTTCLVRCMGSSSWSIEPINVIVECESVADALLRVDEQARDARAFGCTDLLWWVVRGRAWNETVQPDLRVRMNPTGGLMVEVCDERA